MNRRTIISTGGAGLLSIASLTARNKSASEEIIDIHQHINFHGRRNEDLVRHQRAMGISRTVLLPSGSQRSLDSTDFGKSNGLAARVFGTRAAARLAREYPDEFVYFCNEVPDLDWVTKELETSLESGAVGIGELKFNLDCDSPPMIRIYEVARAYRVPVLLHFQFGRYNQGFNRFHRVLKRFPSVDFIGHAQTWWGNIDAKHQQEVMYPKGPVTPGGLTDRYLSDFPNLYGDLSAGSGRNALNRDEEHAAAFLERHQDKLMLGTDCADATGEGEKCSGSGQIENVRKFAGKAARRKIFVENARRVIGV